MKGEKSRAREKGKKQRLKEKQINYRVPMTFKADFSLIRSGKLEPEGVQYDPSRYHHNVLQSQNEGGM